jgi:hypothetical protein
VLAASVASVVVAVVAVVAVVMVVVAAAAAGVLALVRVLVLVVVVVLLLGPLVSPRHPSQVDMRTNQYVAAAAAVKPSLTYGSMRSGRCARVEGAGVVGDRSPSCCVRHPLHDHTTTHADRHSKQMHARAHKPLHNSPFPVCAALL